MIIAILIGIAYLVLAVLHACGSTGGAFAAVPQAALPAAVPARAGAPLRLPGDRLVRRGDRRPDAGSFPGAIFAAAGAGFPCARHPAAQKQQAL